MTGCQCLPGHGVGQGPPLQSGGGDVLPGGVLQRPVAVDLWSRPRCVASAGWVAPDQHTGDTTDLVGEGLHRDND